MEVFINYNFIHCLLAFVLAFSISNYFSEHDIASDQAYPCCLMNPVVIPIHTRYLITERVELHFLLGLKEEYLALQTPFKQSLFSRSLDQGPHDGSFHTLPK